eukprot:5606549-Amphidinium_carterae.1
MENSPCSALCHYLLLLCDIVPLSVHVQLKVARDFWLNEKNWFFMLPHMMLSEFDIVTKRLTTWILVLANVVFALVQCVCELALFAERNARAAEVAFPSSCKFSAHSQPRQASMPLPSSTLRTTAKAEALVSSASVYFNCARAILSGLSAAGNAHGCCAVPTCSMMARQLALATATYACIAYLSTQHMRFSKKPRIY